MPLYTAALTLFLVMDPLGNVPLFLSVLSRVPPHRRLIVLLREMIIAFAVLVIFLFFGRYILAGLDITEPALSIGGGVVLFLIAIRMVFPAGRQASEPDDDEPLIVPLAIPLMAGPSAIATVILFATQYPDRMLISFAGLGIAWVSSSIILISADALRRFLGARLLSALERLMGMILTTLAVQMLLSGIELYIGTL